jgi:hypothetical protein
LKSGSDELRAHSLKREYLDAANPKTKKSMGLRNIISPEGRTPEGRLLL